MTKDYDAPELAILGDASALTLGGEVFTMPDFLTHRRFFRP